jgi:hypothetical protein
VVTLRVRGFSESPYQVLPPDTDCFQVRAWTATSEQLIFPNLATLEFKNRTDGHTRQITIRAMTNLTSVVNRLHQERNRLSAQLEHVTNAISALNGVSNHRTGRRTISAAGRARIAAAQRARWAKRKGQKVVSIVARKRTMSAANRRKVAAAQRARWAKWRKAQKKG